MIVALVDFIGELKVDGRDAVCGSVVFALEDLVALAVLDLENDCSVADRLQIASR